MRSTFMGLETARRGMFSQQSAIYTTGHNISNANTPGYSRQRVNFQQASPYPANGINRPYMPGQMGTGVEAGSIQRIRDSFIDARYRSENNKLGYYGSKSDALSRMEDVMNEPTSEGLSSAMDNFWNSLQTLGTNPIESGARESVLAQGHALADTFNYLSISLNSIREDIKQSIKVNIEKINTLAVQINGINQQISQVEPHGDLPNDLYDERDRLVDELSQLVDIKVTTQPSGGLPSPIAEGIYKIEIISPSGTSLGTLVDKNTINGNPNKLSYMTDNDGYIESLKIGSSSSIEIEDFAKGSLKADIESYGYINKTGNQDGRYPEMIDQLDKLAFTLLKELNHIHKDGKDLDGNDGKDFFNDLTDYKGAAGKISMVITNPNEIATSLRGKGNGDNGYRLADVLRKDFSAFEAQLIDPSTGNPIDLKDFTQSNLKMSGNIKSFYGGLISSLGVETREANVLTKNTLILLDTVDFQRQSVSGVSLDEEMANLIKFQHAYNASARNITVIDEMLDKIINGMGVVGR
ncbi:flagellar hook-associated protein FlgK [Cytobacillus depressus]|uniref:Flagellar hook-associated protein 1 n=1 Tax=Cytobacillus depressus TaxID=1602942 RepID=A0A6L3V8X1_9BACI|nr:flagellar hook-associated protein FlgK [Cytobacillus depressus]KAB2336785.1 flagellar hook-associated protein FlgK [Cytobacillus depressus]